MILKELISHLQQARSKGPVFRHVQGVTSEVQRVKPGMVYVAVSRNDDGFSVQSAIRRGATAIISEGASSIPTETVQIQVPDVREAMARAASVFHEQPATKLKVVGVAGGEHRAGVAAFTKQLLEGVGFSTGMIGSVGIQVGSRRLPPRKNVTPESAEIHELFAQMVRMGCKVCVLELTREALLEGRALGIELDAALLAPDLDGLAQPELLSNRLKPAAQVLTLTRQNRVLRDGETVASGAVREVGRDRTAFDLEMDGSSWRCVIPLPGRQTVSWALGAMALARAVGVPPGDLVQSLPKLTAVPGRMERIQSAGLALQPAAVFLQKVRTDDDLIQSLTLLRELTAGRLLLLLGAEGGTGADLRRAFGRTAALLSDYLVITSDNPRSEDRAHIALAIADGFSAIRPHGYEQELDRAEAIRRVISLARTTDTVLIAGKGDDQWDEADGTIVPFDDAELVQDSLLSQRLKDFRH